MFPTEPMTPERWKALGCLVLAVGVGMVGFGVYGLAVLGLGSGEAWHVVGLGAVVVAVVALIWYLVRRWVG